MKRLTSFLLGAMAVATTAFAADYQVAPAADGTYTELAKVIVRFDAPVSIDASKATNSVEVTYNIDESNPLGAPNCRKVTAGMNLAADGNDLVLTFTYATDNVLKPNNGKPFKSMTSPVIGDGKSMQFTFLPNYTVGGVQATENIVVDYILSTAGETPVYEFPAVEEPAYQVSPAEGWLNETGTAKTTFTITFDSELSAPEGVNTGADGSFSVTMAYSYIGGPAAAAEEQRGTVTATAKGNTISYTTKKTCKIGTSGVFATTSKQMQEGPLVFTIAAGTYNLGDEPGEEIVLNYILAKEDPNGGDEPGPKPIAEVITPAADSHNATLPEVVVSFGEGNVPAWVTDKITAGTIEWNSLRATNSSGSTKYKNVGQTAEYTVRDNALVITMPYEGLVAGKYVFYLDSNKYTVNGAAYKDLEFTIYIDEPNLTNAEELSPVITPSPSIVQPTSMLDEMVLTLSFPNATSVLCTMPYNGGCQYSPISAEIAAAANNGDNFIGTKSVTVEGNTVTYMRATKILYASGDYNTPVTDLYVFIPAGSLLVDGVYNKDIAFHYVVGEAPDYFAHNVAPAEGEVADRCLNMLTLDFYNAYNEDVPLTLADPRVYGSVKRNGVEIEGMYVMYEPMFDEEWFLNVIFTDDPTVEYPDQLTLSDPGKYEIIIPAGAFYINELGNSEIVLTYNIPYYPTGDYVVTPAENSKVKGVQAFYLQFDGNVEVVAEDVNVTIAKDGSVYLRQASKLSNETENTLKVQMEQAWAARVDEELQINRIGEFTFTIPEGSFKVEDLLVGAVTVTYDLQLDGEDINTSVEGINAGNVKVTVYDMQGRVILRDADAQQLKGLKGLVIVNGEKQIRK